MLVLTFQVNQILYAVPVSQVIEVVPRVTLRVVPHTPSCFAGLLHYRGTAVPVIDLALLMGRKPSADRLDTRILMVRGGSDVHGGRLGLMAEQVNDLVEIDAGRDAMTMPLMINAPYLGQVFETKTGLLQLLDPDRIAMAAMAEPEGTQEL